MSFGVFTKAQIELFGNEVFFTLMKNALPKGKDSDDAETRKAAVCSLT